MQIYDRNTHSYNRYSRSKHVSNFPKTRAIALPLNRDTMERNDLNTVVIGILLYMLGLATVAVFVISGQLPWFLPMLVVSSIFYSLYSWNQSHRDELGNDR